MNIVIFTDAWKPQVNGVVTCYENIINELHKKENIVIKIISHLDFKYNFSVLSYPEIKIPIDIFNVFKRLQNFKPDYVHIATPEGTVGISGMLYCMFNKISYTTSYHTKLPEYIEARYPISKSIIYFYERICHLFSKKILITSDDMIKELNQYNFNYNKMVVWKRGVDFSLYSPKNRKNLFKYPSFLYVGRVSIEKNLKTFLDCSIYGTKIIVGDGPYLKELEKEYSDVQFLGYKFGQELADIYASADVFVFPSLTDTFGIVLLESIASGTPVACYDVTGPKDIIINGVNGFKGNYLKENIEKSLFLDRDIVSKSAMKWSWKESSEIFLKHLIEAKIN